MNLELCDIRKSYGDCHANKGVSVKVRSGTIHALVGENGAGKSTAMRILYGLERPDSGEIRVDGKAARAWTSKKALAHGVGMVHQHFMLADSETLQDNIVLGAEKNFLGFRRRVAERARLEKIMADTGLEVPLQRKVSEVAVGVQSRCEILRQLYRDADFLILDEPTAVLTPKEIQDFLETLRRLRARGKTILLITHKLNEVMSVADEVTILRAGATIKTLSTARTSPEELSELMVGRKLHLPKAKQLKDKRPGAYPVGGAIPLELPYGMITGIAGVEGNGQEDLLGEILRDPATLRDQNIAIIPSDRHREGLVLQFNLSENLRLGREQRKMKSFQHFSKPTVDEEALLKAFDVRPPNPRARASALSGGNQQKLIFAREMAGLAPSGKNLIVAVHPTRGVDLGAIEFLHQKLINAAESGAAVLLISSELEELMSLSHRIGVLYRKKICRWFDRNEAGYDEKAIGLVMLTGESRATDDARAH